MNKLLTMIAAGQYEQAEARWMTLVENDQISAMTMQPALRALNQAGKRQMSGTWAWMALAARKERVAPDAALKLGITLFSGGGDNEEMRNELVELFKSVYADRDNLESLISESGLAGGKMPRRVSAILNINLNIESGSFLLDRSNQKPARVVSIDAQNWEATVDNQIGELTLGAIELSDQYELIDPDDYRALVPLDQQRVEKYVAKAPDKLIIPILKANDNRIDSDELESLLSATVLDAGQWSKFWTRARNLLKRNPNVRLEGRNPVTITYDETEVSLTEDTRAQFNKLRNPIDWLVAAQTYKREAAARKDTIDEKLLEDMVARVQADWERYRHSDPPVGWNAALVLAALDDEHDDELACTLFGANGAEAIPIVWFGSLPEKLWPFGLIVLRKVSGDRWPHWYLELLPTAPLNVCEEMAEQLAGSGHESHLAAIPALITANPVQHAAALLWLFRGTAVQQVPPSPLLELLSLIFQVLRDLPHHGELSAEQVRHIRAQVRSTLAVTNHQRFRAAIKDLDPALASTVRRQIERADGLGRAVQEDLLKIVREYYPQLYITKSVAPWEDAETIYTTSSGLARREAELKDLVEVKMTENARAISAAAEHGDLSENSEYKYALEERDLLRARVAEIQIDLSKARVISPEDVSTDRVSIGTRVQLRGLDGASMNVSILGPWDTDLERFIFNYQAPVCHDLMAKQPGQTVSIPEQSQSFTIETIEPAI